MEAASMSSDAITLSMLPTELFFYIFEYVPPRDMVRCRQVCMLWKDVIDTILRDGHLWERFCRREYGQIYKQAMWKTPNITNWFEMYRSFALWGQLEFAAETINEFCHSNTVDEEMRSALVQAKGVILVHKRTRVCYHDLMTLQPIRRSGFTGQYIAMKEFEDVAILLGLNGQLHIVNKPHHDWHSDLILNTNDDDEIVFEDIKLFVVDKRTVYFSTYRHELFTFHLDNDKTSHRIELPEALSVAIPDGLGALGCQDGCLFILTMSRNMYMYVNKKVFFKFSLASVSNLMNCLYQHNMLENIDWRHYYIMHGVLKHRRHTGLLQFISKMHVYGDHLFFVGTQSGVVCVYYKPLIDGELNLPKFQPVKTYNFTLRIDIPILSVYPILNIEVTETIDGHRVLICMPRKILVVTYKHDFEKPVSRAVVPYMARPVFNV